MVCRIFYLPGLGANERLFEKMRLVLPGECLPWPEPEYEDLNGFAGQCIDEWQLKPEDVLVGFSFGAQVAIEIRKLLGSSIRKDFLYCQQRRIGFAFCRPCKKT